MYDPQDYELQIDDIPTWMRPRHRGIDWALLAVVLLCLVISAPLITRTGLPASPEAELEMYRIMEVSQSLEAGVLYPRWAADFNYGYGSPVFNYLAPLPHYLGGLYVTLTQELPYDALKVMLVLPIFILGLSTFGFVRRYWGELAGVVAAAVVLFAPFTSIMTPYLATNPGALWVLALFAASLYALDRAFGLGKGRDLVLLGLASGGLLLADTALSPLLFGFLVAWGGLVGLFNFRQVYWNVPLIGLLCGVGLAAFYLLPAYVERNDIRWQALSSYPDAFDTSSLFAALPPFDRATFNPLPMPYLGVATWLLAVLGGGWWAMEIALFWRGISHQTRHQLSAALFFVLAAVGLAIMMRSPRSSWWAASRNFAALRPVDLLGPLAFCCAVLAAQVVVIIETYLQHISRRMVAIGIVVVILGVSAANGLYVPDFVEVQGAVTSNRHLTLEVRGYALGTLRDGHLLPADVEQLPSPSRSLGDIERIDKLDRQSILPNTPVTIVSHGVIRDEFVIDSPGAQEITILTFNFPGWQAERNGRPIAIGSLAPAGLIRIPLQDGDNEIDLRFRNTPVRTLSWWITGGTLGILILGSYFGERRTRELTSDTMNLLQLRRLHERQILAGAFTLALALLCVMVRIDPDWVTHQTATRAIPSGVTVLNRIVENSVSFLGYQLDKTAFKAGETVYLDTYWQANYPNLDNFQIELQLMRDGEVIQRQAYRHLASWPSKLWPLQKYVVGNYAIALPDAPGTYQISLQIGECERTDLAPCDTIRPRSISDFQGTIDNRIVLPQTITVR